MNNLNNELIQTAVEAEAAEAEVATEAAIEPAGTEPASAKPSDRTLANIGGYPFQKEEAAKIVTFFRHYGEYTAKGAHLPKGVIFYGVPGTGKTLFANAIANEAGAPMFLLTSDEFYKQTNLSVAIAEVFAQAKAAAPSIVLIDELDQMVFCEREFGKTDSDKQREALRSLLTEIDKLDGAGVLVIATANKDIDFIPAALVRNGRIEKHVKVGKPDKDDRKEILSLYLSGHAEFKGISVEDIATYTNGFTGASLESLVNDVLIECIGKGTDAVFGDFLGPIEAIRNSGIKEKQKEDKTPVIYHELGHFIADYVLNGNIGMINTVPYTKATGIYAFLDREPDPDKAGTPKDSLTAVNNSCIIGMAGLVATEEILGEPYMGASADIANVTSQYLAMAESGLLTSDLTAAAAIQNASMVRESVDVNGITISALAGFLDRCKDAARTIIRNNRHIIDVLFAELKEKSVLTHEEIEVLVKDLEVVK